MRPTLGVGDPPDQRTLRSEKLWGRFEQGTHNLTSTVKTITVAPGGALSRQYHHRDELWVVLDPGARVELGGEDLSPGPGEKLYIPRGTVHGLLALGEEPVRIELAYGCVESEEDAGGRHVRETDRG
jgi:mannose-1-phosphate guanylyltransferase/mannose-6-phosphate isomerase